MLEKIQELVAEGLGVEAEKVVPTARFNEDLGADSLDLMELVMSFEEEFGVDIFEYYPNINYLLKNNIIEERGKFLFIKKEFRYVANSVIVKFISDF